ncbi:MAG: hypothetical protein HQ568_03320 [Calditrichaeota bacterium]|nr:hypothetical protein [Calditrichota bacterium]
MQTTPPQVLQSLWTWSVFEEDRPRDMLLEKLRIAFAERGEISVELKREIC